MNTTYYKNDNRIIKIEPNPFKKPKLKIKMRTKRMNGTRPIVSQNGQVLYKDEDPQNMTRVPGTDKTICPARTVSGIKTGLNKFVPNPYDDEPIYKNDWGERMFKGKEKAKLQHLLEYEFGFDFDYLTSNIPHEVGPSNKPDKKFFEKRESKPVLKDNTTFLNMSNPVHRINYYTLLASKEVANSFADLEEGLNQYAEWYVVDDNEKEQYKLSKIEKETKAAAALEYLKETDEGAQQMAKALDLDEASDRNLTVAKAARLLYDYYNQNENSWKQYMDYVDMYKDAGRRAYVIAASELYDYIKVGVISYRNGKYTWTKRGDAGSPSETYTRNSKKDMINNFLLDPAYQDEIKLIEEEYEAKIK